MSELIVSSKRDFFEHTLKNSSDCYPSFPGIYLDLSERVATPDLRYGYSYDYTEKKNSLDVPLITKHWKLARNITNSYYLLDIHPNRSSILQYVPLSRAFFKMYEIIKWFEQQKNGKMSGNHLVLFKNKVGDENKTLDQIMKDLSTSVETSKYLEYIQNITFINREKLAKKIERGNFSQSQRVALVNNLEFLKYRPMVSVNLAEGPGGFIEAISEYRKRHVIEAVTKNDIYIGMTLNEDSKVTGENFKRVEARTKELGEKFNFQVFYGSSNTGDMYDPRNIVSLREKIIEETAKFANQTETRMFFPYAGQADHPPILADLVTADGGFNFTNQEGIQEQLMYRLMLSQIVTAMYIQAENGVFVLKFFDSFTKLSVKMIHLLSQYYKTVKVVKPATSRPANAEKYIVCYGFCGIQDTDIESLMNIIQRWWESNPPTDYSGTETKWSETPTQSLYVQDLFKEPSISTTDTENAFIDFQDRIRDINLTMMDRSLEKIQETVKLIYLLTGANDPNVPRVRRYISDVHFDPDNENRIFNPLIQKYVSVNSIAGKELVSRHQRHMSVAIKWLQDHDYGKLITPDYQKVAQREIQNILRSPSRFKSKIEIKS